MTALTSAGALAARFESFGRFVRGVEDIAAAYPYAGVDREVVSAARRLVDRASARLRLSPDHLVVALAGATGGGKSSLFNALSRIELSPAGHLRPTTAQVHACVWNPAGVEPLLDWLGVDPARRFARESVLDAEDEAQLRGLVLLDLPDMDSVATGHRVEVDRLVSIVDLLIWVLDPQKYADSTVHEGYLRHMAALREVTVVAFNQVDRLSPPDTARCLADVTSLLAADGLHGVPVIATSAIAGTGVDEIRALLEKAVAGRSSALVRLEGELDESIETLAPMVGAQVGEEAVTRELVTRLAEDFAAAAGVEAAAADAGAEYARQTSLPGWPLRSRRPLRSGSWRLVDEILTDPAAVNAAVRELATATSGGLPPPWQEAVRAAATGHLDTITGELERGVTEARPARLVGWGWRAAKLLWWIAVAAILIGLCWRGWHAVIGSGKLPTKAGFAVADLLIGVGVLVGGLTLAVGRIRAAAGAYRVRTATDRRAREATMAVAREVVAPVRTVLRTYTNARADFVETLPE